jgi:6-phospho-beta-glucosidase
VGQRKLRSPDGRDKRGQTTWDYWFAREPNRFHNGVGPQQTSTFYQHWKTDIQLLKQLNHNSFRTSISWARLIPDGIGEVNPEAVDFYNQVIDELNEQGITPFITLFHFDMPMAMQEIGGWENRDVVDAYARYAQICFELFGDRVLHWFTFNEPIVPVEGGYLYDFHYPNVVDFAVVRQRWRTTLCWLMHWPFALTAPVITQVKLALY